MLLLLRPEKQGPSVVCLAPAAAAADRLRLPAAAVLLLQLQLISRRLCHPATGPHAKGWHEMAYMQIVL
jgi:hypothetical protein